MPSNKDSVDVDGHCQVDVHGSVVIESVRRSRYRIVEQRWFAHNAFDRLDEQESVVPGQVSVLLADCGARCCTAMMASDRSDEYSHNKME